MPHPGDNKQHGNHLGYLDSVRGIAAIMVVVYHFLNWDYKDMPAVKITNIFINGADAVAFFFVLSGFVLSYKYVVLKHELDIGKFYINRFFRLWPAFFITVIINALYAHRVGLDFNKLVDLFLFNKHGFWQEALLLRAVPFVYYVPGWTLVVEFVMSLFVPFMVILAHQNKKNIWWLAGFFFFMGAGMFGMGMFVTHFIFGVLLAAYFPFITGSNFKQTTVHRYRYVLILAGFILFSMRPLEKLFSFGWFYDEVIYKYLGYDVYYFSGVGSLIILVFIIHSQRVQKILEHGIFRFFGRISYGIYLMHWLVVAWVFNNRPLLSSYFPGEETAFFCLLAASLLVTIILAIIIYRLVELPFIRMSKRLTARMRPTLVTEA